METIYRHTPLVGVMLLAISIYPATGLNRPARADQKKPEQNSSASAEALLARARAAAAKGQLRESIEVLNRAIKLDPQLADAEYLRGRLLFRVGRLKESVAAFDRYVKLRPKLESRQWERGIAMYYAGQYQRGAAQFELYQTYHNNDVENSVWRYLCMARTAGVAKAKSVMLPIENDRRVPMMQVFELYRGNLKPQDVLAAVQRDKPSAERLAGRAFYAHLYLGLWHEAQGAKKQASHFIELAANPKLEKNQFINSYMWDVARIHFEQLKQAAKKKTAAKKKAAKKKAADPNSPKAPDDSRTRKSD